MSIYTIKAEPGRVASWKDLDRVWQSNTHIGQKTGYDARELSELSVHSSHLTGAGGLAFKEI